jgi:acetyl-CoA acetyltransferase
MSRKAHVVGVGMVKFAKPGASDPYDVMAKGAIEAALKDAGLSFLDVEQAYAGYVFGDSTCGQKAVYSVGMRGIPVVNVNNNCSTGSTALWLARQAVAGGMAECVLAVGFEQMEKGALSSKYTDRPNPLEAHVQVMNDEQGIHSAPFAAQMFGGAGREYRWKYGMQKETFAMVAAKARRHASKNPYALFNQVLTTEQVLASDEVFDPLTRFQCCPPTCGAAAAIVCSEAFARQKNLWGQAVTIIGQSLKTDFPSAFGEHSMMKMVGYDMAKAAADAVYNESGFGPDDVQVVELHDCFTTNEVLTYEALGLCGEGQAEQFIVDGDNTWGGRVVTNPSGGLLSKGHPLGATGLAQCTELVWQLRGQAGERQVEGAKLALQHNLGLGGAAVVTMYQKAG